MSNPEELDKMDESHERCIGHLVKEYMTVKELIEELKSHPESNKINLYIPGEGYYDLITLIDSDDLTIITGDFS